MLDNDGIPSTGTLMATAMIPGRIATARMNQSAVAILG